jgi:hypothetical protein
MNFIIYSYNYLESSGGITALYNLAKCLNEIPNVSAKIFDHYNYKIQNSYCCNFAETTDVTDETIVVYPEVVWGNPLNAKKIVRWILAPIGMNSDINIKDTWGKTDLVYYFNSEPKINENSEKRGSIYKFLTLMHMFPVVKQHNFAERFGMCHTYRKMLVCHKKHVNPIHEKSCHPFKFLCINCHYCRCNYWN